MSKVKKILLQMNFNGDMVCPKCGLVYCGKPKKVPVYCGNCYVRDKLILKCLEGD